MIYVAKLNETTYRGLKEDFLKTRSTTSYKSIILFILNLYIIKDWPQVLLCLKNVLLERLLN